MTIAAAETSDTQSRLAYARLREKIHSREVGPGEPITEARVSRLLGVGRGPAREALLRLQAEGLVQSRGPHRSRYVQFLEDLDPEKMQKQFEIREVLDGLAARRAAVHLTGSQILRLRELCHDFTTALRRNDAKARGAAGREVFRIIRNETGNPLVSTALESCGVHPVATREEQTEADLRADRESVARRIARMQEAVEAIAGHDAEAAEAAMRALVREDSRRMIKWLVNRDTSGKTRKPER